MPLFTITDPDDERLSHYVSLRDTTLRHSLEAEEGIFLAEGERVIRRAFDAGYRPRSLMLAERWLPGLADQIEANPDLDVFVVTEQMAEAVTGFHVHRGALGAFDRHTRHTLDDILSDELGARRIVVVEDLVDHANVGAILRAAAGMGWDAVLLAPRAADPLYRRAVKTSMGAVFSLPWARLDDWATDLEKVKAAGFTVAAMALRDDAVTLDEFAAGLAPDEKVAVCMGTEGAGLSERWLSQADRVITIPMGHGVDSLNVASATAVACYVLR